jgi:hypothetical protein
VPVISILVTRTPIAVSLQCIQYKLTRVMSQQLNSNSGNIDQVCPDLAAFFSLANGSWEKVNSIDLVDLLIDWSLSGREDHF